MGLFKQLMTQEIDGNCPIKDFCNSHERSVELLCVSKDGVQGSGLTL